jgi:hypothetical protein
MISFVFADRSLGDKHPEPIGYEDIVLGLTGVSNLTKSLVKKCVGALVSFENGPFRERHDGGLPIDNAVSVNASGYFRSSGDEYFFSREEALRLSVILSTANAATDGTLRVTYYG